MDQAVVKDAMDAEASFVIGIIIIIIASTPLKIIAPPFERSVTTASPPLRLSSSSPPLSVGALLMGASWTRPSRRTRWTRRNCSQFVVSQQHHHHRADAAENHRAPVRAIDSIVVLRAIIIPTLPNDRWRRIRVGGL